MCVCVTNLHSTINTRYACPWVHVYSVTVDKLTPWMFDQFLLWHKLHVWSMCSDNSNYLYGRCICEDKFPLFNERKIVSLSAKYIFYVQMKGFKKIKGGLFQQYDGENLHILVHLLTISCNNFVMYCRG